MNKHSCLTLRYNITQKSRKYRQEDLLQGNTLDFLIGHIFFFLFIFFVEVKEQSGSSEEQLSNQNMIVLQDFSGRFINFWVWVKDNS